MPGSLRKLPIGIQDFESLRERGYLYVDKTAYIYRLVHEGKPYFLSRPRRFGKSLLLSSLKAYWEGRRELFTGLAIERLERENKDAWEPHPVFYFDFNKNQFHYHTALEEVLDEHLRGWEAIYGDAYKDRNLPERFRHLLSMAKEQTGKNAVVLVDEYDKPLLEALDQADLAEHNKAVFKGFFSSLKSYDHYLEFVFLTGVTKFGKISVSAPGESRGSRAALSGSRELHGNSFLFSDLNHLRDISLEKGYAAICGITEKEIYANFLPEVEAMARNLDMTVPECLGKLAEMYDGYHFHYAAEGVYNPYSLLNALAKQEFGCYWFETGTPTFLLDKLAEMGFDAKRFTTGKLYANEQILSDYRADNPDPIPLFYQTGYLTIQGYDAQRMRIRLAYPNNEVKYAFLESLAPSYLHERKSQSVTDIFAIDEYVEEGDLEGLRDIFTALFARLPYVQDERPLEQNFQNVIYIVFMLLGKFVRTEIHSARGRADCIVETEKYVYIFEFKRDGDAGEALRQIEAGGYALPFAADPRTLYKIGANFNSLERNMDAWEVSAL